SLSEPATEAERAVASVWEELLDAGPVGRESNFFELGGDSLMASRVIGRVRALGYEDVRLQLLFDTENLSEFCKTLRKREAPPKQEALIEVDPSKEYESFPLTEIQHAYLVSRGDSSSQATVGTTYCQIFAVDEIDLDRLDAAWGKVQKRHGMMRASVEEDGTQSIAPSSKIGHIERAECANSSEAKQQLEEIKRTVFALAKPPLHRVVSISWHEESGKQTRLVFCFDYTVLDALSVMTVLAELAELYENPGADLPGIGLTFRDFVVGHRRDGREVEEAE
ncbi:MULTISPECIES: condensation domain-containing protein, partial [Eggerthellaceae]